MRNVFVLLLLMVFATVICVAENSEVVNEKDVGNLSLKKVEKSLGLNRRLKLLKRQKNLKEKLNKAQSGEAKEELARKLKLVKDKLKRIRIRKRGDKSPKRRNRMERKRKGEGVSMDQNKSSTPQEIVKKDDFAQKKFVNTSQSKVGEETKISLNYEQVLTGLISHNESFKATKFQSTVDFCKLKRCSQLCKEGTCSCFNGFQLTKDSKRCVDINECFINNGNCAEKCVNKIGYYVCGCRDGYKLSKDSRTCIDIDECLLNNGHGLCEDTCLNTLGSFRCACNRPGTKLSSDLMRCDDIDECSEGISGCSHGCINVRGGAVCTCPDGLLLGNDSKTCEDINECLDVGNETCSNCINTVGTYLCLDQGVTDITCPALQSPAVGFFDCNRSLSLKSSIKWISDRELRLYTPGTICTLNCPGRETEIEEKTKKEIVCGADGNWIGEQNGDC